MAHAMGYVMPLLRSSLLSLPVAPPALSLSKGHLLLLFRSRSKRSNAFLNAS